MAERDLASTVIFRQVGSTQPIIMGNAFDTGTDNYLANKAADISVCTRTWTAPGRPWAPYATTRPAWAVQCSPKSSAGSEAIPLARGER